MSNVFERTATVESWDSDYYHPIAERFYDEAIPDMLGRMGAKSGDMVLDAGCGPGVHTIRAVKYGCKVTAIDISKTMLAEAGQRVAAAGAAGSVHFAHEDLTKLSLPDGSFKFVFSWGVIIHIPDVELALSELARVVAPGGHLALYVNNDGSIDKKIEDTIRFATGKSLDRESLPLGSGVWYEMHGEKLWVWHFKAKALEGVMASHRMRLVHRSAGEFSELQRRTKGPIRSGLLKLNNGLYRAKVPPNMAVANLYVFRKEPPPKVRAV